MKIVRNALLEVLEGVEVETPVLLSYSKEELKEIFFDKKVDNNNKEYYVIAKELNKIIHKIDFANISFDDVKVEKVDFSNMTGVKINPQKVYKKSLAYANLSNVEFITDEVEISSTDLFNEVDIHGAKFENNNDVKVDPQTVFKKDLTKAKLTGIDFTNCSFDDVILVGTDFTGTTGVKINPQTIKDKQLTEAKLFGVDFTGCSFDNAKINYADFTRSIGAKINPNKINNDGFRVDGKLIKESTGFNHTNCIDVILTDIPNPDVITEGAIFNEDNINALKEEKERQKEKIKSLIKL